MRYITRFAALALLAVAPVGCNVSPTYVGTWRNDRHTLNLAARHIQIDAGAEDHDFRVDGSQWVLADTPRRVGWELSPDGERLTLTIAGSAVQTFGRVHGASSQGGSGAVSTPGTSDQSGSETTASALQQGDNRPRGVATAVSSSHSLFDPDSEKEAAGGSAAVTEHGGGESATTPGAEGENTEIADKDPRVRAGAHGRTASKIVKDWKKIYDPLNKALEDN